MSLGPLYISKSGQYIRKNDHPGKWPAWNVAEMNMSSELHTTYARLFAHAPELLEMVETLADGLEWNLESLDVMGESEHEALVSARALIAKVKGKA